VKPEEIPSLLEARRKEMSPEHAEQLTISLRADRQTPMGIINDVKRELQESYALKINYSATEIKHNQ